MTTVCLPGIPDEVPRLLIALQNTSRTEHKPNRAVELRGGGHSQMFFPAGRKFARAVDSLEGRWLIDRIDGRTIKPNEKNILIGNPYFLSSLIGCVLQTRNYAIVANRFAAQRLAQPLLPPPPLSTDGRPVECNETPPPIVDQAFAIIDNVTTIGRIGQHGVELRRTDGIELKRIDVLETLVGEWKIIGQDGRTELCNKRSPIRSAKFGPKRLDRSWPLRCRLAGHDLGGQLSSCVTANRRQSLDQRRSHYA